MLTRAIREKEELRAPRQLLFAVPPQLLLIPSLSLQLNGRLILLLPLIRPQDMDLMDFEFGVSHNIIPFVHKIK